jgi:hypothetical protein
MRIPWAASARRDGRSAPVGRGVRAARSGLAVALAGACVCAGSAALLAAAPAGADVFSSIGLASYGSVGAGGFVQQAEYAHDSAVSADGRYLVFDGSIGGVTGVWRRELATGTIEQVAGGDAAMPSISEDGRYVSFTTNEGASLPEITHLQPDAHPHREAVDVYRRDMDVTPAKTAVEEAARKPGERAFVAASAPTGSEEPLRYAHAGEHGGSYAVGRTAMSADGNEVAFATAAVSDLVAYPALEEEEEARGETPAPHTPAGQVAVHYFDSGVTALVSRCRFECGQGAAAGAAEPVVAGEEEEKPVGAVTLAGAEFPNHPYEGAWPGASISADGTAVAWMGQNVARQAPTLAAEGLEAIYEEPLWRELPAAANQTRRVTGGSDPQAPGCAAGGEVVLVANSENASDPCQGPFVREVASTEKGGGLIKGSSSDVTPRLSRDGEEVLFGANARLIAEGEDFTRGEDGNPTDLFVASMRPGLTRTQALTPLTEVGSPSSEAESAPVTDFEISPDGTQVAFTTVRSLFVPGWPTLVSTPLPEVGISELYDADLANGTLTRITHGYEGEGEQSQQPYTIPYQQSGDPYNTFKPNQLGALTPDFSGSGERLVFTSTAANLVYGDGNSPAQPVDCCRPGDGSDVFIVTHARFSGEPVRQYISPAPEVTLTPPWNLGVTALSRSNGSVVLYVRAPGSGRLQAQARAAVAAAAVAPARAAGHGRHARRAPARRRRGHASAILATRTVSDAEAVEQGEGLTTLTMALAPRYAALARTSGGLSATVTLTFTAAGHSVLSESIPVTFVRGIAPSKARKARRAAKRRGRQARRTRR